MGYEDCHQDFINLMEKVLAQTSHWGSIRCRLVAAVAAPCLAQEWAEGSRLLLLCQFFLAFLMFHVTFKLHHHFEN